MSPACPEISDPKNSGESPSGFKASLTAYLSAYAIPELKEWLDRVKKTDFSEIRYKSRLSLAVFISIKKVAFKAV
jgi:hypothetical protein